LLDEKFKIINTRDNGRCISLRPSRDISAQSKNPIRIDLKDVWTKSGKTGAYKVFVHEDNLEFNVVSMVSSTCSSLMIHFKLSMVHFIVIFDNGFAVLKENSTPSLYPLKNLL
jgi:hypothetical protein